MINGDREYYRRREAQERCNAENAEDTGVRRAHLEMASHYSAKLRDIDQSVTGARA